MMVRVDQMRLADGNVEALYGLTDISRKYLEEFHKPLSDKYREISQKLHALASSEDTARSFKTLPYDHRAIQIRGTGDRVAG